MKRKFVLAIVILAGIFTAILPADCKAQDSSVLLDKIESANSKADIRKGKFTEERRRKAQAPQSLAGELVFDSAGTLSMTYSTPEGDFFNIAGGFIAMKNNGVENKFDLTKNRPMKSLADLLISSFAGKLQDFSSRNSCLISAEKTAASLIVTVSATKKGVKGYSKVVVDYDPKTCLLTSMVMEEFDGSVTVYKME